MRFEQKYRSDLSPLLHEAYDIALSRMQNFELYMILPLRDEEEIRSVLRAVFQDHPEIFWYDVYDFRWMEVEGGVQVVLIYLMTLREVRMHKAALEAILVREFHKLRFYDDFRKVNYVHNYFMEHVTYQNGHPEDHTLFGPMLLGKGCCEGISLAFTLIMNYVDVPCFLELGDLHMDDGSWAPHAWVAVKVLGHWTYCDPTNDLDGMRSFLCVGAADLEGLYRVWNKSRRYDFSNRQLGYHSYNNLEFVTPMDAAKYAITKLLAPGDVFRCKFLINDRNDHGGEFLEALFSLATEPMRIQYQYRLNMQTYVFERIPV